MTLLAGHLTDDQAQLVADGVPPGAEVEQHLAGCAACQASVAAYRLLASALEDLELPELPTDFTDGVLARIDVRERALARERKHAVAILSGVVFATVAAFAVAGASAWAPVVSSAADLFGSTVRVLRIGSSFVPDLVGALRFQIIFAAAVISLPLLLALARLMPAARTETA